ncbi:hypothetical protein F4604DRAFT_1682859 [Suillus subluteus]|nr:hypothetical protein F4604DRAFT_1682859 [Suillus subluteus]
MQTVLSYLANGPLIPRKWSSQASKTGPTTLRQWSSHASQTVLLRLAIDPTRWRSTYFERNLSTSLGFGWEVLAGGTSWRMVVAMQETLSERPWEALKSAAKGVITGLTWREKKWHCATYNLHGRIKNFTRELQDWALVVPVYCKRVKRGNNYRYGGDVRDGDFSGRDY